MQDDPDRRFGVGVVEEEEAVVPGLERFRGHGTDEGEGDVGSGEIYTQGIWFSGSAFLFSFSEPEEQKNGDEG